MGAHTTLVSQEERQQLGVVVKEEHSEQYKSWKQVRALYSWPYVVSLYLNVLSILAQKSYKAIKNNKQFFEETVVYWEPKNAEHEIYNQFSEKKFREILKDHIE